MVRPCPSCARMRATSISVWRSRSMAAGHGKKVGCDGAESSVVGEVDAAGSGGTGVERDVSSQAGAAGGDVEGVA
eukprot:2269590-Rhodomonas_salina.1